MACDETAETREEAIQMAVAQAWFEALSEDRPIAILCCMDFERCTNVGASIGCGLCEEIVVHPDGRVVRDSVRH